MNRLGVLAGGVAVLLAACVRPARKPAHPHPSVIAADTQLLQGIWLDDDNGLPVLKVKGDSIYFASRVNLPQAFRITGDSLVVEGAETAVYRIGQLDEHTFSFYTAMGDLLSLHKAETDTMTFGTVVEPATPAPAVEQKDKVVIYQGQRYRGYVYINPSSKKVVRPSIAEDGMFVDNIYYDNVIHICVYQGTRRLFGKDIKKEMFAGIIPEDFLHTAILSDMDFTDVTANGYEYCATVCMPDASSCYYVEIVVSEDGRLTYRLMG